MLRNDMKIMESNIKEELSNLEIEEYELVGEKYWKIDEFDVNFETEEEAEEYREQAANSVEIKELDDGRLQAYIMGAEWGEAE